MGSLLFNKTPWTKEHCGRQDCLPCQTKPGKCKSPNITYRLKCVECQSQGVKSHYVRESHRTFYDRAREHSTALRNKNKSYSVVKHWADCHPELKTPPRYSYHLIGKHMSATERQIKEGLAIERESREVDNLLNGEGEWGINIVPRLQSENDRLGKIEENQALTSSTNGKRQAEFRENQPTATHSFSSISPAQNDNTELAFSGQYRQRKKARLTHKASDTSEGQTRPMS